MIRSAILAVVIALAMGPVAHAEFWISVDGVADPPGPGVWLEPNETAVVRIHSAHEYALCTNMIVLEGAGSADLAGMSIVDIVGIDEVIVDVTDDPDFREYLADLGYSDPFAIIYSEIVHVGTPPQIPFGVMIDGIILRGEAEGVITVSLLDAANGPLLDTQVVHVGDKPVPILQQGLVAHWELDEGEGLIAHDSAGDSNGIIYGAAWASGQIGQALDFNGIDDYVDCGNDESLNLGAGEFSISAWINPRSFGADEPRPIISKWQDEPNRWYLHTYNDCVEFTSKGQGNIVYVAGTEGLLDLDRWHHVCFVAEGKGKMYVDGEDRTDWATHPPLIGSLDNSAAVKLGSNGSSETPTYFDGLIDDIRIYDRNLSPGEVRRLYDMSIAGGGVFYVDGPNGDDDNAGLTRDAPFATIQKGIYSAWPGESVLVLVADGVYRGTGNRDLHLRGPVTLRSVNGPHLTVIDCDSNGHGISFTGPGDDKSVLDGFTITHCGTWEPYSMRGAIYVLSASPTISDCLISSNTGGLYGDQVYTATGELLELPRPAMANCTFVDNVGYAILLSEGTTAMTNCISWGDELRASVTASYCDIEGGWPGVGNIDVDPLFVDPCNGDYRLLPGSPCIDAGDNAAAGLPETDLSGRARTIDGDCNGVATVDMGAYEFIPADVGDLDADCDVDLPDLAILAPGWRSEEGDADYRRGHDINWPPDGRINWRDILVLSDNWLMAFGP